MELNKFMELCNYLGCIVSTVEVFDDLDEERSSIGYVYLENHNNQVTKEDVGGTWVESPMSSTIYNTPEEALEGYIENNWDQEALKEMLIKDGVYYEYYHITDKVLIWT